MKLFSVVSTLLVMVTISHGAFTPGSQQELDHIAQLNSRPGRTWTAGVPSEAARRGWNEIIQRGMDFPNDLLEASRSHSSTLNALKTTSSLSVNDLPTNYDARTAVPECADRVSIYNQGRCGTSWSIPQTTALGYEFCRAYGADKTPKGLSAFQLSTCDKGGFCCNGGYMKSDYLVEHGVCSESCIPYQDPSQVGEFCPPEECTDPSQEYKLYKAESYTHVAGGIESLKQALVEHGMITTGYMIRDDGLFYYESGVFQCDESKSVLAGHGISIAGYGIDGESGLPFWLLPNSWGADWGEDGFLRVEMGKNCGGIETPDYEHNFYYTPGDLPE